MDKERTGKSQRAISDIFWIIDFHFGLLTFKMQRKLGISSTLIIADSVKSCQMFARVQRCFFYYKWNNNGAEWFNFVRYIIVYKNMSQMLLRQAKKPWFSRLFVHKKYPLHGFVRTFHIENTQKCWNIADFREILLGIFNVRI